MAPILSAEAAGEVGDVTSTGFGFAEHHRDDAPGTWGDGHCCVSERGVDELLPSAERLARVGNVEKKGEGENPPLSKQSKRRHCARRPLRSETLERLG
jgi:hypothetical protein